MLLLILKEMLHCYKNWKVHLLIRDKEHKQMQIKNFKMQKVEQTPTVQEQ